jgi:hypothetical protein
VSFYFINCPVRYKRVRERERENGQQKQKSKIEKT